MDPGRSFIVQSSIKLLIQEINDELCERFSGDCERGKPEV
jgi:hypothetical protein